jgi:uncharacterized membrane protein YhaH (DUF805 family)
VEAHFALEAHDRYGAPGGSMAGILSAQNFRFLFRNDKGSIDRHTWWIAMAALAAAWIAVAIVATGVTVLAESLAAQDDVNALSVLTQGVYLSALFNILIILVYVCYYFVSAKRYNDLGKSPRLALILPAAIYILTFSPILADQVLPVFGRWIVLVVFLAVAGWQIYELGFRKGRL